MSRDSLMAASAGDRRGGDGAGGALSALRNSAKAAAALEPGEPLCICYGPKDLLQWDLAKRRSWLKAHCGFACACPRCLLEEAAQASGAAARPRAARWWPW